MIGLLSLLSAAAFVQAPIKVEVVNNASGWHLMRAGTPYFVKGGGGMTRLNELVASGGNSVRTWGADHYPEDLDAAEAHHLTVAAGIWLAHKSDLDYSDADKVQAQFQRAREIISRFKNHPAVLVWGLGNEMEADNDTPALWKAVGAIAHMAKELDPNHPTMTVVAEVSDEKIKLIQQYAPDIDILGVNSYGGLSTMPERLKSYGWTKPYIVTEFGPLGEWERPKTSWGAPLEQTSTEKAAMIATNYSKTIPGQPGWCLGGYAFLWGNKQETTPTWFSIFMPTGEPTESVEVMQHAWTGKWPDARAPQIADIRLGGPNDGISPNQRMAAQVKLAGDGSGLKFAWSVVGEVDHRHDGIGESLASPVDVTPTGADASKVSFRAPAQVGAYRLYLVVKNQAGVVATANLPFRVTN